MRFSRKSVAGVVLASLVLSAVNSGIASAGGSPYRTHVTVPGPKIKFYLGDSSSLGFTVSVTDGGTADTIEAYRLDRRYNETTPIHSEFPRYIYDGLVDGEEVTQRFTAGSGWSSCFLFFAEFRAFGDQYACQASPVDDAKLTASDGWKQAVGKGHFMNTISATKARGQTLKLENAVLTHFAVVATVCPGCGSISIKFAGADFGTESLEAASTKKKRLFVYEMTSGTPVTGTVSVKVTSDGKPVKIDGIGVINNELSG